MAVLPGVPSFSEMFESLHPEIMAELRAEIESENVPWPQFTSTLDQRMSMLNAPMMLLIAIPMIFYFKLIRRDRPLVEHAVFTLNCCNVYVLFLILGLPIYMMELGLMLASLLPLLLVPYLLAGLWAFYYSTPGRFALVSFGLLAVGVIGYVVAANIAIFIGFFWASHSVMG
ncbi:hypothetical protein IC757_12360 [Wenzhouxiangella sp. AB-CW3]|uniref:hypothetical protein n=1 Tax=Wenzhouxiangella sp. AB-CW3 TaxID=2771012 RepID=UPI00168B4D69|nr:hypothetical protein [Wenzhouxiangella sp. AB-CW3]QOC21818.1 hypothetical protein IC757_12360 [Wenzhouxiangella sp. AB-CW3]